jgi:hypothetical protein
MASRWRRWTQVPALSSVSAWRIAALYAPATATIAMGILMQFDFDSATTGRSMQCSRFSFEKDLFPLTGKQFHLYALVRPLYFRAVEHIALRQSFPDSLKGLMSCCVPVADASACLSEAVHRRQRPHWDPPASLRHCKRPRKRLKPKKKAQQTRSTGSQLMWGSVW